MSGAVTIRLPWPPSVNTYWRSVGRGRVLISERGRAYRQAVALAVRERWPGLRQPTRERLTLSIYACPPDRRARDLDNLPKAILDALTRAGVWQDDSQIDGLAVTRRAVTKGGFVDVGIECFQGSLFHRGWRVAE